MRYEQKTLCRANHDDPSPEKPGPAKHGHNLRHRPTFSPARLCHVVYAGFSGGQMETILAWDSTSHGGKMPEGYLHLTCEQRCQIYALLQSGHSQAHIARQIHRVVVGISDFANL